MSDHSLREWLKELEAEHASREVVIAEVRRKLGLDPNEAAKIALAGREPTRDRPDQIAPDEFFRLSVPDAIKKFLAIKKSPQPPSAIVEGLQAGGILSNAKSFYSNVTTALKRLRLAGDIDLTPNGWGLSEWYPNRPKGSSTAKKGKATKKAKRSRKKAKAKKSPKAPTPKRSSPPVEPAVSDTPLLDDALATTPKSGQAAYRQFMGEQRKAGKSMKEAAGEWKLRKLLGDT